MRCAVVFLCPGWCESKLIKKRFYDIIQKSKSILRRQIDGNGDGGSVHCAHTAHCCCENTVGKIRSDGKRKHNFECKMIFIVRFFLSRRAGVCASFVLFPIGQ